MASIIKRAVVREEKVLPTPPTLTERITSAISISTHKTVEAARELGDYLHKHVGKAGELLSMLNSLNELLDGMRSSVVDAVQTFFNSHFKVLKKTLPHICLEAWDELEKRHVRAISFKIARKRAFILYDSGWAEIVDTRDPLTRWEISPEEVGAWLPYLRKRLEQMAAQHEAVKRVAAETGALFGQAGERWLHYYQQLLALLMRF